MSPDLTLPLTHVAERRTCAACPNFIGRDRRADAKHCSDTCRKRAYDARHPRLTIRTDVTLAEIVDRITSRN